MRTKNLAVTILAGVLVLAVWYQYLLKPTQSQASKVHAQTATERSKLDPLQHQLDQARAAEAHKGALAAQLASLKAAVPNAPALSAFIRDANQIAAASGVTWQSVTHGPPTPGAGALDSITVGIQIKGTYAQVIDYVGRLAALQRLLVVDTVQLNTAGNTGAGVASGGSTGPFTGASELTATISARMFASAAVATAAGSVPGGSGSTSTAPAGAQTSTLNNS